MQNLENQVDLKGLNTFAVQATAAQMLTLESADDVISALPIIQQNSDRFVLGGGSNILFMKDYCGLVIYPQIFGILLLQEDDSEVLVSVGASENWHQFVLASSSNGWFGLENLALIPGTVGAAPVQNIGAYGVEVKQFIQTVEYVDLDDGGIHQANNSRCEFAYRDSFFKQASNGRYLITRVEFKLLKQAKLNLNYKPLAEYFDDDKTVTPSQVIERVCQIRRQKLPDPAVLANAGSFFKNPSISEAHYQKLKQRFPEIAAYAQESNVKIAAGWLIENAGFKGFCEKNTGVHRHQALVLVNYGDSDGNEIWDLAQRIQAAILERFDIHLEPEVRIIGNCGLEE